MAAQPETIRARRRYAPMRHPGRRGRWDADAIRAALRAVGGRDRRAAAVGGVVGHAARARRAGPAQVDARAPAVAERIVRARALRLLERPRSRRPACPVRRLTFTDPVAERVATARRLAAGGATVAEVAAHLGVSTSTAGNYLRAGPCPGAAGRWSSPAPSAARAARATSRPSPGRGRGPEVLEAVRAWCAAHGARAVLPRLDPVAFAARAVGGREPALAERGRRLPPVRRPRRPVGRRAGRGRPAAALRALARRAHPVRARRFWALARRRGRSRPT